MGNRQCCGRNWSCPSVFQKKKRKGSHAQWVLKSQQQQQQQRQQQQNGTKGRGTRGHSNIRGHTNTRGHTAEGRASPERRETSEGLKSEDSNLHYADIRVYRRSAQEVKHLPAENATEYATLRFPAATPRYDSKNGTLV
ncbi:uncharacterized protein C11orf52 homolog [Ochotona princeps]|uniref:uncharacterized protein C11orf52 homolog n=1 Tax=Ochotona princeps TaxID=9978 RepID=UPI002715110B|nr:uncharacterized protein C11orf52 homolog [Ochotona princeps]